MTFGKRSTISKCQEFVQWLDRRCDAVSFVWNLLVMALIEVSGHYVFAKLMWLVNTESFAVWLPRDNVFVSIDGNFLEHFVKLERKRKLNEKKKGFVSEFLGAGTCDHAYYVSCSSLP